MRTNIPTDNLTKVIRFAILASAVSMASPLFLADGDQGNIPLRDLNISMNIDGTLYTGVLYDSLFRIVNMNYSSNTSIEINLTLVYNISRNESEDESNDDYTQDVIKEDAVEITNLRQSKTSGTGEVRFNESTGIIICGTIMNSTVFDENYENDIACETYHVQDASQVECNVTVSIDSGQEIYNDGDSATILNTISNDSYPFIIEYWAEDLFGEVVKDPLNTTNTDVKQFTVSIDETDRAIILKNRLVQTGCENNNEQSSSQKLILVKKEQGEDPDNGESSIRITGIGYKSGSSARFGEAVNVGLEIHKGDTQKRLVEAWSEDREDRKSSEVSKAYINDAFATARISVPVILKPNCDNRLDDGEHRLIVEGLDVMESESLRIEGVATYCPEQCEESDAADHAGQNSHESQSQVAENSEQSDKVELVEHDASVKAGNQARITMRFSNSASNQSVYDVYSYIYRGSKSYSGIREENIMNVRLLPGETKTIEQSTGNVLAEPGEYLLKIRYRKSDLKSWKEFTANISIVDPQAGSNNTNTSDDGKGFADADMMGNAENDIHPLLETQLETQMDVNNSLMARFSPSQEYTDKVTGMAIADEEQSDKESINYQSKGKTTRSLIIPFFALSIGLLALIGIYVKLRKRKIVSKTG